MTYPHFMQNYVLPFVKKHDKPFNRMLFNDSKDAAHKNNNITDKQVNTWDYPKTKYFV